MFVSMMLVLVIIGHSVILFYNHPATEIIRTQERLYHNMTHEFKTPISTISLACQALTDKDIPHSHEMYDDYIHIIGDENHRLGEMAEKILQTAILEKGSLHFGPKPLICIRL